MSAPYYVDLANRPDEAQAFWLKTPDAMRLRAAIWPGGDRGTVAILPGRTEYIEKYGHVARKIRSLGFSAFAVDWRGQGLATRPFGTTEVGHVDDYREYQTDLRILLADARIAELPEPTHLLAHSMGGCIGLRALVEGTGGFSTATFSAPMWGLGIHPLAKVAGRIVGGLAIRLGQSRRRVIGQGPETYATKAETSDNVLTSEGDMLDWIRSHVVARPELGLGGPSYGWLVSSLKETAALQRRASPSTPTLTFLGSDESIVDPGAIRRRMDGWPEGSLTELRGARHEILIETPEIRQQVWQKIAAHWNA